MQLIHKFHGSYLIKLTILTESVLQSLAVQWIARVSFCPQFYAPKSIDAQSQSRSGQKLKKRKRRAKQTKFIFKSAKVKEN